jgi:hypothetical protein
MEFVDSIGTKEPLDVLTLENSKQWLILINLEGEGLPVEAVNWISEADCPKGRYIFR